MADPSHRPGFFILINPLCASASLREKRCFMKIEQLPIDQIEPYAQNAKIHPPDQVDKIARSITEFGFQVPILIDADNIIVAGHGRHLAARQLGLKKIPCIRADGLTPDQIRAYRIADNKLPELGAWDWAAMSRDFTLEEIATLSPSIGLTQEDLAAFMDAAHLPLSPDEAALAVQTAAADTDISHFEADMAAPVEPKMAIVPQYCEEYEAFIIVCTNSIDEAFMRQALDLNGIAQSYVDSKIRRANILTVEQFKQLWESR
jgi:hypothetical protein